MFPFFSRSKQQVETNFDRNSNKHFFPQLSCNWLFYFILFKYLLLLLVSKIIDLSFFFLILKKKVKLKVTFQIRLLEGSNWITSWFNMVMIQWFNLGLSVRVVKKLLSSSPFMMKVPFVTFKLILFNSCCMITCFESVFSEIHFVHIVLFIHVLCFAIFLGPFSPKKNIIQENKILSRWSMSSRY